MGTTKEYGCADGTPLRVTFRTDDDANELWSRDLEHAPLPVPPLEAEVMDLGVAGAVAAYADHDFPAPPVFVTPAPRTDSGHVYFSRAEGPPDFMSHVIAACVRLFETWPTSYGFWRDDSLPRVREVVDFLVTADDAVPIAELAERHAYGQNHTMISAFLAFGDMMNLQGQLNELYGEQAQVVTNELVTGCDNITVEVNRQLWEVGRAALASPSAVAALRSDDPASAVAALDTAGDAGPFLGALDEFLGEHGLRSEGWLLCQPTWAERGPGLWNQLRVLMSEGAPSPDDVARRTAARRAELVSEIEQKLGDDAKVAAFRESLDKASKYVAVREERCHWQLVLTGALRHALLRRGEALVDAGRLAGADDVLFLLPPELADPAADLKSLVEARRADYERWLRTDVPLTIGAEPGEGWDRTPTGDSLVQGKGASRGVVTGRARVVTSLADADDFEAGDVLVCTTTTPPWTPLFALAGAVVTDGGDLGSHTAISAREYGIPAVVDTFHATTAIPDGALVTVDGTAGTVVLA